MTNSPAESTQGRVTLPVDFPAIPRDGNRLEVNLSFTFLLSGGSSQGQISQMLMVFCALETCGLEFLSSSLLPKGKDSGF